MLRCIKASITQVSCKLKNPLKTKKIYNIIHKAEKQLLYELVININNILESLNKQRKSVQKVQGHAFQFQFQSTCSRPRFRPRKKLIIYQQNKGSQTWQN